MNNNINEFLDYFLKKFGGVIDRLSTATFSKSKDDSLFDGSIEFNVSSYEYNDRVIKHFILVTNNRLNKIYFN